MPKNDEGEFELILGNKQLLSMFFVVVVLLGVFFVMGYIVGRNSAPLTAVESAPTKPQTKPLDVTPSQPASPETTPESSAKPAEKAPPPATTAKAETPASQAKVETKKSEAKAETPAPGKAAQSQQPAPGSTYLQLVATTKHDADAMVDVLRKNNFPAIDNEVPDKPGLYRVLVGPVNSAADYNKLKADLQSKGFEGNRAFKKTF